jgi:hypothetical protein
MAQLDTGNLVLPFSRRLLPLDMLNPRKFGSISNPWAENTRGAVPFRSGANFPETAARLPQRKKKPGGGEPGFSQLTVAYRRSR